MERIQKIGDKPRGRGARTSLDQEMFVRTQTIGSGISYALRGHNISRTGMLLSWSSQYQAPFRPKTIIEMEIDSQMTMFHEPLHCLGKVVRIARVAHDTVQYGVLIVQFQLKDQNFWEAKISELEDLHHHSSHQTLGLVS